MVERRYINALRYPLERTAIPKLYVVTDTIIGRGRSHAEMAAAAAAGGAGIIQLRDKHLSPADLLREAVAVREALVASGALFVVNDSLDVAIASGADGVHLGQGDGSVMEARAIAEAAGHGRFLIGVSVGSVEEASRAVGEGADYIALSPVFPTTSKEDAGAARGLLLLREIRKALPFVPLVAIGGINPENVGNVLRAGADSVAVVSAVVGQDDMAAAAQEMRVLIENVRNPG
jgi:thiamine-phosphate pyrophosphorylase